MKNEDKYVMMSLELHLFYDRIMKEHALFIASGFACKDVKLTKEALHLKCCFEKLLADALKISNNRVRESVINSGELFTKYTLDAENKTEFYTGIDINSKITSMEKNLQQKCISNINSNITHSVKNINCKAIKLLTTLIKFKRRILNEVLCCDLFTKNYPSLLKHMIEEAELYCSDLEKIEEDENIYKEDIKDVQVFWNHIMMEHSLFIRGQLDIEESKLIIMADKFAHSFEELNRKIENEVEMSMNEFKNCSLQNTENLRDFKNDGAKGILNCKIKSVILPLLADHVLREANHYIRILKSY